MTEIRPVRTREEADATRTLAREFVEWLKTRYPELHAEIDTYLVGQKFEENMADVRIAYGPPAGECLLAFLNGQPVGVVMVRDKGDGICEMNRMFVRAAARGHGIGRALVERLIDLARDLGYRTMVLAALNRHTEALALYRSCGFTEEVRPPSDGEPEIAVLMRRDLSPP